MHCSTPEKYLKWGSHEGYFGHLELWRDFPALQPQTNLQLFQATTTCLELNKNCFAIEYEHNIIHRIDSKICP